MKVLVTGGAGFVASHIVSGLLARGDDVLVVDNLVTGRRGSVSRGARFLFCDIRADAFAAVVAQERPEAIIHHAAQPTVGPSVRNPLYDLDVNLRGLLVLLTAAAGAGTRQIVFASSGGTVYGSRQQCPIKEDAPTEPESPYGVTKLAGEQYIRFFARSAGMVATILRYANIFGPRDHVSSEHVITVFAERMLTGRRCAIHWDGEQAKDYVYVEDIVRANLLALDRAADGTYNIGSGRPFSVNELFAELAAIIGPQPAPAHGPKREGDVRLFSLDGERARSQLGWAPTTPMRDGLARTVAWFREELSHH